MLCNVVQNGIGSRANIANKIFILQTPIHPRAPFTPSGRIDRATNAADEQPTNAINWNIRRIRKSAISAQRFEWKCHWNGVHSICAVWGRHKNAFNPEITAIFCLGCWSSAAVKSSGNVVATQRSSIQWYLCSTSTVRWNSFSMD